MQNEQQINCNCNYNLDVTRSNTSSIAFLVIGIFILSFLIYIIFGLSIIECQRHEASILGLDSYSSFSYMYSRHYSFVKLYKHPLIDVILMPFISMFSCLIKSARINALFCQALAASLANVFFFLSLNKLCFNNYIKIIFSGIFMLSFSNLIFSSVPELYIYSGLVQILFLYSVISITQRASDKMNIIDVILLAILTVLSFGINMFNIVIGLIFIFYVVLRKNKNITKILYNIFLILITSIILFLSFSFAQHKIYHCNYPFYNTVKYSLNYKKIHPRLLANTNFYKKYSNSERIYYSAKGTLINHLLPSYKMEVQKVFKNKKNQMRIEFGENYSNYAILAMSLFLSIPLFYIIKNRRSSNSELCLMLLTILIISLIAYSFYGFNENILYSQNHLCCLVLLLGLLYNNVPLNYRIIFCSLFFIYQIYCNVSAITNIENYIIHYFQQNTYFTNKIIFYLTGILLLITMIYIFINVKYKLKAKSQ